MGALSQLVDPSAPRHTDLDRDLPDIPEVPGPAPSLHPSASQVDAMLQAETAPETLRDEARTALSDASSVTTMDTEELEVAADRAPPQVIALAHEAPSPREEEVDKARIGEFAARLQAALSRNPSAWESPSSSDASAHRFYVRRLVMAGCAAGGEADMAAVWKHHAPKGAPSFQDVVERQRVTENHWPQAPSPTPQAKASAKGLATVPARELRARSVPDFPQRTSQPVQKPKENATVQPPREPQNAGGSVGLGDFVRAPFVLAGAAGSLVLAGLQRAGGAAQGAYMRSRANGHAVLAGQLDRSSAQVAKLAEALKGQGMGGLVEDIRRTGAPSEEVFRGMAEGGKYDALGKKYDKILRRPEVAETMSQLKGELDHFGHLSRRYAKTGAALGLDVEEPIKRGASAMAEALKGVPVKEQGKFSDMQDRLHEMMERIAEMVRSLFQRLHLSPSAP